MSPLLTSRAAVALLADLLVIAGSSMTIIQFQLLYLKSVVLETL